MKSYRHNIGFNDPNIVRNFWTIAREYINSRES